MFLRQLIANFILFFIGVLGLVTVHRSVILILMCLEVILLSASLNYIIFSVYLDDIYGQLVCLLILTIAAAESSIALAIIIAYNRRKNSVYVHN